ncbi:peptidase M23 [Streptomyces silvensis]|uniref:Peptidase M23 n=1 Tax=Streptomyces silvensis TaxID=1765722 RepID=A0A0W7XB16_9ACTN|nr:peptidase M23 [Streptomyces silvensis]
MAAALAVSPLAVSLGLLFLVTTWGEDEAAASSGGGYTLSAGKLRVGPGYVPAAYAGLIEEAAAACDAGLPAGVLAAQLKQESGFNPKAKSPAKARGIAQFVPGTWNQWGRGGNVWNPKHAIPAQGRFMCSLLKEAKKHPGYDGSPIELALAGYNAGWGAVQRYHGIPPYKETRNYVRVIMGNVKLLTAPDTSGIPENSGGWGLPVKAPVGTPYHQAGSAWSSGYHTGIDFAVPIGTKVRSIGPAKVVAAGPGGSYGNQVVLRHADGMYSQYAHMARVKVSVGGTVQGGQVIGISGKTGNASGPHLHLEIRTGPAYGSDISPVPYLRKQGVNI